MCMGNGSIIFIGWKIFVFSLRNLDFGFLLLFLKNINGILILGIMGFHNIHDFEFLDFWVPSELKNRSETDKIRVLDFVSCNQKINK